MGHSTTGTLDVPAVRGGAAVDSGAVDVEDAREVDGLDNDVDGAVATGAARVGTVGDAFAAWLVAPLIWVSTRATTAAMATAPMPASTPAFLLRLRFPTEAGRVT